jgi:para-aminobenzoate synthetase/4-amino-4-deoxychorismate lyase
LEEGGFLFVMNDQSQSWFTTEGMIAAGVLRWIDEHRGSLLFESNEPGRGRRAYLFTRPKRVIAPRDFPDVLASLEEVERGVAEGLYAAGFLTYEAGAAFEPRLARDRRPDGPLAWFGLYERPVVFDQDHRRVKWPTRKRFPRGIRRAQENGNAIPFVQPGLTSEEHREAVGRIQKYIAEGDTYQVNFTFPLRVDHTGEPAELYDALRRSQRVAYSAFLNTGEHTILSLSPELFFHKRGSKLVLKPMKGTMPRGRTEEEDMRQRRSLEGSAKDRAENLMIVDLLRNDAGRIAEPGSVRVRRFFDVERYETVFQATSTIEARIRKGVGFPEMFRALFPSGSVTGAPKIRTMQIIRELERSPRGVYTGSIGFITPSGDAVFNVAIRTAVTREPGRAEVGVGSGIVHDSNLMSEYEECLLKARFLTEPPEDFQLLETMLWQPARGWFLLPLHLKRLRSSARYFGFRLDGRSLGKKLAAVAAKFRRKKVSMRVRALLSRQGELVLEHETLAPMRGEPSTAFSPLRTSSRDRFLFHKTTRRKVYEVEYERASRAGLLDVIVQNERGEVTEGTRSNLVIKVGGQYFTPPLDSGALPGVFRQHLISSPKFALAEKSLYPDDVLAADEVYLCNAVRGMVKVKMEI